MTAICARSEGHWLRLEPPRTGGPAPRRSRARDRLVGFALAVAALGTATVVVTSLVTSTATSPPARVPLSSDTPARNGLGPPPEVAASISRWSRVYGVPAPLLEALTWHESRWQAGAVSEAGAMGIGQLMPDTAAAVARSIGATLDPWNLDDNIRMTAHLLGTLLTSAGGDVRTALAGYAQGAAAVQRDGMTTTTRQYVNEIVALYDTFR